MTLGMKYLHYASYASGNSGLSNAIMSIEIGVILAHLTDRVLVNQGLPQRFGFNIINIKVCGRCIQTVIF